MVKKSFIILLAVMTMLNTTSCTKEKQKYQASFLILFNSVTEIMAYADTKDEFSKFATFIYDELEVYHQLYDKYNMYEGIANIKTINDNAGVKPVKVDQKIIDLLLFSKDMNEATQGKTNVAMGAVLEIWHEYRINGIDDPVNAKLPPYDKLLEASKHCDIDKVIIDQENSTVFLEDKDMSLDVGAIGKGYATEMVSKSAIEEGYTDYLLSVGGNIRSAGLKTVKDPKWSVGIQNPYKYSEEKTIMTLYVTDLSVVSSGDYERYYMVDGKRYNHIIDPDTLMPAEHYTAVTVVCPHSGMADAFSTAIYNMDFEEGNAFIEQLEGVEAMWIMKDGEQRFSSGYEDLIKGK